MASGTPESNFDREADRLYEIIRRSRDRGEKVVMFSTASAAMYAGTGEIGREDGPVYPSNAYGRHNLALESVITTSGVDHLILRLAHVVGSGQPSHHLVPGLIAQVRSGSVRLFRGARRDVIDAVDMARAVDGLITSGADREIVNVVSGNAVAVERIVDHIEFRLGIRADREYVPTTPSQPVANERFAHLVPDLAAEIGDDHYFRRVLDRYLGCQTRSDVDSTELQQNPPHQTTRTGCR